MRKLQAVAQFAAGCTFVHTNLLLYTKIFASLLKVRHAVRPEYMRKQTEITHNMRSILIDWMVEVAEEYKLERETLCLSILYVDRFLSVMAVARNKLQLVGAAAMFLASLVYFLLTRDESYQLELIIALLFLSCSSLQLSITLLSN